MVEQQNAHIGPTYEIKIKGHLNASWADWFGELTFTHASDGTTILSGEIIDQSALHPMLKKLRDLGLPLLSVNCIDHKTEVKNE